MKLDEKVARKWRNSPYIPQNNQYLHGDMLAENLWCLPIGRDIGKKQIFLIKTTKHSKCQNISVLIIWGPRICMYNFPQHL